MEHNLHVLCVRRTQPPSPVLTVVAESGVKTLEEEKLKEEDVTWMSLPHKSQLAVLTMARLSEPMVQTSLQVM